MEKGEVSVPPGCIVLIQKGPTWTPSVGGDDELRTAHLAYLKSLMDAGHMCAHGLVPDGGDVRAIHLYQVQSADHVRALAAGDPAVKAGRYAIHVYRLQALDGLGPPAALKDKP